MAKKMQTIDGNYAASYVAYAFSEVAARCTVLFRPVR